MSCHSHTWSMHCCMWTSLTVPNCHNHDYALLIADALSAFCQVLPCKKTIDGEGVLKLIQQHGIRFYGPPVRIHSDKDIRLKGDYGW